MGIALCPYCGIAQMRASVKGMSAEMRLKLLGP